jgi:hypothetical protein
LRDQDGIRARTVVRTDGTQEVTTFEGEEPPLAWMQEQVGGYIELVASLRPRLVFVNEEARMKGFAVNELAFEMFGDVPGTVDGRLLGNVIIVEHLQ